MYKIRDLIQRDHTDAFEDLPKTFELEFEDGVCLNVRRTEFIYSNFFYMVHRCYPKLPVKSTHFISVMLNGKMLDKSSHSKLLTIIFRDLHAVYDVTLPEKREHLMWLASRITDNIDNIFTQMAEPYVATIDAMDIVQVLQHPEVRAIIEETDRTETSLRLTDEKLEKLLMTSKDFDRNGLVLAARTKSSNIRQILQSIGLRGYHTEVDGARLSEPTMGNYALGLRRPYDLLAGSLEASKSLYYADSQIQDTEYFGRRLQLLTMVVEKIHYEDCGSTNYIDWMVQGPSFDENGDQVFPGDIQFMVGKKYIHPDTNQLETIKGDEKELIGRYIRLRSPMTCRTPNQHHVCHVCFGDLALNIPEKTNIGFLCAATMTQQATQNLLSNKHLAASSLGMMIILTQMLSMFFLTNRGKNKYILKSHLREMNPSMIITKDQVKGLSDIREVTDQKNINPRAISEVSEFTLKLTDSSGVTDWPVVVEQNKRHTVFTLEFLEYLLEVGWEINEQGHFVFDLVDWDFDEPILELPDAEYNYADHAHQIALVIESNVKNSGSRQPVPTLQELFKLTNSKLNVNLVCLEVIMYACMIPYKGSVEMGRDAVSPVLGSADYLLYGRSASSAYAYEKQASFIMNPQSFFLLGRPDSPMDVAVAPKEVIEHYYPHLKQ